MIPVEDGTLGRGLRLLPDADDEWFADGQWDDGGVALWVDGVDRGHLFTRHPERLRDAALQRLASVLEASAPLGEPLAVLHHGSGTFALARYVAATRPDSKQLLIDVDPDSTRLVAESWPLPRCAVRVDAPSGSWFELAAQGAFFDLVVLDLSMGTLPAHMTASLVTARDFFTDLRPLLGYAGTLALVLQDRASTGVARALAEALSAAGMRVWTLFSQHDSPDLVGAGALVLTKPAEARSSASWTRSGFDWGGLPAVRLYEP